MIPVGAPPAVLARLRAAPDGPLPVVHRGPDAVYLAVGGSCVGVLGRHAVGVPCGLRTQKPRVDVRHAASIHRGVLRLDDEPVVVGRLLDVAVPTLRSGPVEPTDLEPAPPFAVEEMVGRGDGLTPYDDDVVCGWVALHRAAGVATPRLDAEVRAAAHRTTLLSATLLDCALRGEVIDEFATWVRALGTPAEPLRAAGLARLGHSSGRGLLRGARLALESLDVVEEVA